MAEDNTNIHRYGGQAVVEGVMMRGKEHFAVACRRADGRIESSTEHVEKGILGRLKWLNKPFLRGTLALIDTFALGAKALMWSANIAMEDEQAKQNAKSKTTTPSAESEAAVGDGADKAQSKPSKPSKVNEMVLGATLFLAIPIGLLLFLYLPAYLSRLIAGGATESRIWLGLVEGGLKMLIFFLYVWLVFQWKEIRRVFQYHGAEHKVINAYEAGEELNPQNVQKYSTIHVRCGTSFILVVILVGIIVFIAVPWNFGGPLWLQMLKRVAFKLPLLIPVAGIAYEIIKLAGSRKRSLFTRMVLFPGLLMQRLTTQEPSDDQVEVAIKALECVFEAEKAAEQASSTQV